MACCIIQHSLPVRDRSTRVGFHGISPTNVQLLLVSIVFRVISCLLRCLASPLTVIVNRHIDNPTPKFGEALRAQVEERLNFFETGAPPSKNADALRKVLEDLELEEDEEGAGMEVDEPIMTTLEPEPKEKKRKRKSDDMDVDQQDEGHTSKKSKLSKEEKKALKKEKKEKAKAGAGDDNEVRVVSLLRLAVILTPTYRASHQEKRRKTRRRRRRKRRKKQRASKHRSYFFLIRCLVFICYLCHQPLL